MHLLYLQGNQFGQKNGDAGDVGDTFPQKEGKIWGFSRHFSGNRRKSRSRMLLLHLPPLGSALIVDAQRPSKT
jgi:hypothetical protein